MNDFPEPWRLQRRREGGPPQTKVLRLAFNSWSQRVDLFFLNLAEALFYSSRPKS